MTYDFHSHTLLSDGSSSPIELIRFAYAYGYSCIGITDHASYSNLDSLIESVRKDCELAEKYWDIIAIPGVELTNIPVASINEMAKSAKEQGARMVVVHGETIVEEVEEGTNLAALRSEYVDLLAHPGILTSEEAELAAKNDIYIEITSRSGHSLANGRVVETGRKAGVKFLINSDSHSFSDLYRGDFQRKIAYGSGLCGKEYDRIVDYNQKEFLKKIGY
ncbi:MAG: histidinol phosphate phosphatase domain-containing protein [Actinobacteria bacterium]|nr:histidinol phosphate phosphatase domain-containing protein [Actinomycetota bacterium]